MISVIIPVYNAEKYLNQCLNSVINQSYKDIEIILVDDGSTDDSPKICDEYAINDNRIILVHKNNGGVSSARNAGLSIAKGEYIQFIDSDDYISETMFESLYKQIVESDADIAVCRAFTVDVSGKVHNSISKVTSVKTLSKNNATELIFNEMNNALWNKLIKHSIIKNIRFEEGRTFGEDPYFLVQVLKNSNTVCFIPEELYYYRKNETSITATKFSEKKFDQVYFKDKMYEFMSKDFTDLKELANKWRFTSRLNICRMLFLNKKKKEYNDVISQYKNFMIGEYPNVKKILSKSEKLEYSVFKMGSNVYSAFVNTLFKR